MNNSNDLVTVQAALDAIPAGEVKEPSIPVEAFIQEAENLTLWASSDAASLAVAGITNEMIQQLPVRAGALREAQSLWFNDRHTQKQAEKDWQEQSPAALDLRDELLHAFSFAFRKDSQLRGRVSAVREGYGNDDLIQDLNDLAVLGRENTALLSLISFDESLLHQAADLADKLAPVLALANGSRQKGNEAKILRDRAYVYLKELVDEIRLAGKYVFRKDPERLVGYVSHYWKRKRGKKKEDNETTA